MSITPASLLQKPRKILNTGNNEKYNRLEGVGLRLFADNVKGSPQAGIHGFYMI